MLYTLTCGSKLLGLLVVQSADTWCAAAWAALLLQYTRQKEVTRDLQAALQKAQAQTQLVLESKVRQGSGPPALWSPAHTQGTKLGAYAGAHKSGHMQGRGMLGSTGCSVCGLGVGGMSAWKPHVAASITTLMGD